MYRMVQKTLGVGVVLATVAITPAIAQSTLTFTPVTSCVGAHVHVVPVLDGGAASAGRSSSRGQADGGGSTSAPSSVLELADLSPANASLVQACAYGDDGSFLGGASFTLPASTRILAVESSSAALTVHQLFGLSAMPSVPFHAIIATDQPTVVQGGNVGPLGHAFFIEHGAHPGTILGMAPLTHVPTLTGTLMLVNTASQAATYTVEFLDNSGTVLATATTSQVPGLGRLQATLASLAGQAAGLKTATMLRVTGAAGQIAAGWVVTIEPEEFQRTAYVLGVVQP